MDADGRDVVMCTTELGVLTAIALTTVALVGGAALAVATVVHRWWIRRHTA